MSIRIKIGSVLRQFVDNQETATVKGKTIRECLEDLSAQYPDIKRWLFDSKGLPLVMILFQGELVSSKNLDRKVNDGEELEVHMVVGGG